MKHANQIMKLDIRIRHPVGQVAMAVAATFASSLQQQNDYGVLLRSNGRPLVG